MAFTMTNLHPRVEGSMSIKEFYSSFENLCTEYTDIICASVPPEGLIASQSLHKTSKCDQFLMKLKVEFEAIRSNLMNRDPVPLLDICITELLKEEQWLITQLAEAESWTIYSHSGYLHAREKSK